MEFEWDDRKNRSNFLKHGIWFEDAIRIFDDVTVDEIDGRIDYGEVRISSVGILDGILYITVTTTDRSGRIRLITARQASRKERRRFENATKSGRESE